MKAMRGPVARTVVGGIEASTDDVMLAYFEDHYSEDAMAEMAEVAGHPHKSVYKFVVRLRKAIDRDCDVPAVRII